MDVEKEKQLLAKYPFHIYLMVKAAMKVLEERRAIIKDDILVMQQPIQGQNPPSSRDAKDLTVLRERR